MTTFYPDPRWLETVSEAFRRDPAIACITGYVVADGILAPACQGRGPGERGRPRPRHDGLGDRGVQPYGCNMAFRCSAIAGLRFDEKLVLYGWLEDRDFGSEVAKRGGRVIKLGGRTARISASSAAASRA